MGVEEPRLPARFVTSRGSDTPVHSARAAYWLRGPASRDCARARARYSRGEAGLCVAAGLTEGPGGRKRREGGSAGVDTSVPERAGPVNGSFPQAGFHPLAKVMGENHCTSSTKGILLTKL